MKRIIFGLLVILVIAVCPFNSIAQNTQRTVFNVPMSVELVRDGLSIDYVLELAIGNRNQNVEILDGFWKLYNVLLKQGWRKGRGQFFIGSITFICRKADDYKVYALISIGKNDCPGELRNKFKIRKNKVYLDTLPRALDKCIDKEYLRRY